MQRQNSTQKKAMPALQWEDSRRGSEKPADEPNPRPSFQLPDSPPVFSPSQSDAGLTEYIPQPVWLCSSDAGRETCDKEAGDLGMLHEYPTMDNSPIESVRATVSKNDDKTLPVLTFRFWILGTLFAIFGAMFTQYYYFTHQPMSFSVYMAQLGSYLLGLGMAKWLPRRDIGFWKLKFTMNPGPFNMKEHALIGIVASTASIWPFAIHFLASQRIFFEEQFSHSASLLLLISSQIMGYGLAGIVYPILVEMPQMVWPVTLVNVALYNTLHERNHALGRQPKKIHFFWMLFGASFVWHLFPQFIAPVLVSFAVICYFGNTNPRLAQLGGATHGVGILNLSFDWNELSWIMPLSTPWWAQANIYFGAIVFLWIIVPVAYYANLWESQTIPIVSMGNFDNTSKPFNISRILDPNTAVVNSHQLDAYSSVKMSGFLALAFGGGFIAITSVMTHVYLWHSDDVWPKMKATILSILTCEDSVMSRMHGASNPTSNPTSPESGDEWTTFERDPGKLERDACIHANMMRVYPKVPAKWYLIVFGASLAMACVFTVLEPIALPMWGIFAAIILALVALIPCGIIQALTNQSIGLNIVSEVIAGYIFPGRPIANSTYKTYSTWLLFQCLTMVQQFKLGQYMKIPPRYMFIAQIYGTILSSFTKYFVMDYMLNYYKKEITTSAGQFSSGLPSIFYTSSVIWGAVGPQRIFGHSSQYFPLVWLWFIGFLLPIPFYYLHKAFPRSWFPWRFVNIPLIFFTFTAVTQVRKNFIVTALLIGFATQFYMYRYRHVWWRKYNYVANASIDSAAHICGIVVFVFANGFFTNVRFPKWIGNNPDYPENCMYPTT